LVDGKYARILVEQKQYAQALPLLKKFLDPLLQKQSITDAEEQAAAEALLLLGDCQRNTGELYPALDSYLTITTLFDVDPFITVPARQHAAEIFEQQKRWPRARQTYQELIDHGPPPAVADDARKKLAALNAAHPE
jgi:tetratricopeptide (TPR) repeat protein